MTIKRIVKVHPLPSKPISITAANTIAVNARVLKIAKLKAIKVKIGRLSNRENHFQAAHLYIFPAELLKLVYIA